MASRYPAPTITKWLQLKVYQVEVTFSVYIFTPLEKFIFCTSPFTSPPPFFSPQDIYTATALYSSVSVIVVCR